MEVSCKESQLRKKNNNKLQIIEMKAPTRNLEREDELQELS